MSAPLLVDFQNKIAQGILSVLDDNGEPFFAKRGSDFKPLVPAQLAEGTQKLVEGISLGMYGVWVEWQAKQSVTILPPLVIDTLTSAPIAGVSGPGSLT